MEIAKYPFRENFQNKILALMIRDKTFIAANRSLLRPGYFDNYLHATICAVILQFYDNYDVPPSIETLKEKLVDHSSYKLLCILLAKLSSLEVEDHKYIKEKVIDFSRQQAVRRALLKSEDLVKAGRFEEIQREVTSATLLGNQQEDLGFNFATNFRERVKELSPDELQRNKLPTYISSFDRVLNGGIDRGEVNIVLAPPESGKSIWLVNMAYAGLWKGLNVLFVSLELRGKKIAWRLYSRVTGIPLFDLYAQIDKAEKRFNKFIERVDPNGLRIKYFPEAVTFRDLESLIINLEMVEGFSPDLLIVDYLDLMKPAYVSERGDYEDQGTITKELRSLAGRHNLYLWTATQAKRDSLKRKVLDKDDKADSWKVIMDADVIVGLMRDMKEDSEGRGRLTMVKVRDGDRSKSHRVIPLNIQYERMYIGTAKED